MGCTFITEVPDTTISARNELRDLLVTTGSDSISVMYVNLNDVSIGDVHFNKLLVGDVTSSIPTDRSGSVGISIGSAVAMVATTQGTAPITITDIDAMTTYIRSGEENTVIFDESSASSILETIQPPKMTSFSLKNELIDLVMTIDGSRVTIQKVNLKNISVGGISTAALNAGDSTGTYSTSMNGTVNITIGSADVTVTTEQGPITKNLTDIGVLTATLNYGEKNTVVFDETSAPTILASLKNYLKTTIVVKNELYDLEVTTRGVTTDIEKIDLLDVTIGDVNFTEIGGNTTTGPRSTTKSGTVSCTIASARATVLLSGLGGTIIRQDYTFSDIDPMEVSLKPFQENIVIFDETTAANIFSALAKRQVAK
jgi:hypothetical protein